MMKNIKVYYDLCYLGCSQFQTYCLHKNALTQNNKFKAAQGFK